MEIAEMVCYLPVPAPFVRFGGEWVDEALGFAMGWNFYLNMGKLPAFFLFFLVLDEIKRGANETEAFLVPFEIVAMSVLIRFWSDDVPVWAVIVVMIVLYTYSFPIHPLLMYCVELLKLMRKQITEHDLRTLFRNFRVLFLYLQGVFDIWLFCIYMIDMDLDIGMILYVPSLPFAPISS